MKIRQAQLLLVTAIPVLVGIGFISLNRANAEAIHQIAQASQPPNLPPDGHYGPPRIDFASAAAKLGVTEAKLKDALGELANPPSRFDRNQRPPRPDFKGAAQKLGVTEQQLIDALGIPPHPPGDRPPNLPDGESLSPPPGNG